jgi:hypothetical protein
MIASGSPGCCRPRCFGISQGRSDHDEHRAYLHALLPCRRGNRAVLMSMSIAHSDRGDKERNAFSMSWRLSCSANPTRSPSLFRSIFACMHGRTLCTVKPSQRASFGLPGMPMTRPSCDCTLTLTLACRLSPAGAGAVWAVVQIVQRARSRQFCWLTQRD